MLFHGALRYHTSMSSMHEPTWEAQAPNATFHTPHGCRLEVPGINGMLDLECLLIYIAWMDTSQVRRLLCPVGSKGIGPMMCIER
jgi:hypothetical protein